MSERDSAANRRVVKTVEGIPPEAVTATNPDLEAAFARLRRWSRMHEPVYKNPSALRADVRLILDELVKARAAS